MTKQGWHPAAAALVALTLSCCGGTSVPKVSIEQHVYPALIRNPQNPLARLTVEASSESPGALHSIEIAVEGSEHLEAIELFESGEKGDLAAEKKIAEAAAANRVTLAAARNLQKGPNVFWLSCRVKPSADLAAKVSANVVAVRTGAGSITAFPNSEPVRRRIGIALRRHNDDGVHTHRIPALATGPKETLYAVYDMRRRMSRDLQEDIDIGLSRSTDGGRTWEPPRVIMDMGEYGNLPQEQNGVSDPGIVVDGKTGEIFVFAVWMWGKPGKHQWNDDGSEPGFEIGKSAQLMIVRSRDDGLTWTKPENLTRKLKRPEWWLLAPSPQQGINLPDGTLVLPAQGRDAKGVPFATLMVSRNHGATWTVGTPAFSGGNECQAVQLGDGSIMLNMRNDHERFRAVYVTSDLGKTWRPHETNRNTLIEPNCNASLRRFDIKQGAQTRRILLFSNPHSQKARTHHTIQVSFDDGRTWPEKSRLLLDEGRGRGYSSMSQVDNEHVGIVYEGSRADIVFEKIAFSDLIKQ